MIRLNRLGGAACLAVLLAGCGSDYSPNTYATTAVQQANKVEQGVIVGVRRVDVSAQGVVGAATGGAAGGIVGSQVGPGGVTSAIGALGGTVIGGLVGTAAEHASADTFAFEYVVRKANNDLVSVTQKDKVSLAIGQKVLVISGNQARIVPDYTVPLEAGAPAKPDDTKAATAVPVPVSAAPLPPPVGTATPAMEHAPPTTAPIPLAPAVVVPKATSAAASVPGQPTPLAPPSPTGAPPL